MEFADVNSLLSVPAGMIEYLAADGVTRVVLVLGETTIQYGTGSGWTNVTGALVFGASGAIQPSRITLLEFGTPGIVYAVMTNGVDPLMQWDTGSAATLVAGTPPVFTDITTTFDRIVGIVPPYTVRWGEALDLSTWNDLNTRILADTPDRVVAIRNLGNLGAVIYKERTIWTAQAQSGPTSSAFRFELRGYFDGPAGPAAVVDVNGGQFYMTNTGRIGLFTGTNHQWVCDGLWPHTRALIDHTSAKFIVGTYDPQFQELYFFYPRLGDSGNNHGMVIINLPYPQAGIQDYAAFPGETAKHISAACLFRDGNLDLPLLGVEEGPTIQIFDGDAREDEGDIFESMIQTGLVPTPDLEIMAATVEPYFLRGAGRGTITMNLIRSYMLETLGGSVQDGQTYDLTDTPVKDIRGHEARGRFFGLQLNWQPHLTNVEYFGSHLMARRLT